METLKRRSNSLIHQVQQHLPSVPTLRRQAHSQPSSPNPAKPKPSMRGTWKRLDLPLLPRSSHSLVAGADYIFGGEQLPRQPVDNDMHVVRLPCSSAGPDYYALPARPARPDEAPPTTSSAPEAPDAAQEPNRFDAVPPPRVGHATAVIGARIFLFGGRGGPDMQPLNEAGRVWVFDVRSHTWTFLDPVPAVIGGAIVPHPAPRGYHCATSTDHPQDSLCSPSSKSQTWRQWIAGDVERTGTPQNPVVGNVAAEAVDEDSDGYGTFIHAGCLAGGDRANDLWAFDVRSRTWTALPAAPGPSRGGTAICISKSRLFHFGGFNGTRKLGGRVDFLPLMLDTFDDGAAKGEVSIHARAGGWQSILADNPDASSAEIPLVASQAWPAARSVAAFQSLTLGGGREYLVLAMGETEPSASGHAGAGAFASDVWTFQVPPLGMSAASWTDAMLQAVGRQTGEGKWVKVVMGPRDPETDEGEPVPRAWLASAPMTDVEDGAILLFGGLSEDNERVGDGWVLRLGT